MRNLVIIEDKGTKKIPDRMLEVRKRNDRSGRVGQHLMGVIVIAGGMQ